MVISKQKSRRKAIRLVEEIQEGNLELAQNGYRYSYVPNYDKLLRLCRKAGYKLRTVFMFDALCFLYIECRYCGKYIAPEKPDLDF